MLQTKISPNEPQDASEIRDQLFNRICVLISSHPHFNKLLTKSSEKTNEKYYNYSQAYLTLF